MADKKIKDDDQQLREELEFALRKISRKRDLNIEVGCIRFQTDRDGRISSFRTEIIAYTD